MNKRHIGALVALCLSSFSASAQSIDETVNSVFASATGWFVSLIFQPHPRHFVSLDCCLAGDRGLYFHDLLWLRAAPRL